MKITLCEWKHLLIADIGPPVKYVDRSMKRGTSVWMTRSTVFDVTLMRCDNVMLIYAITSEVGSLIKDGGTWTKRTFSSHIWLLTTAIFDTFSLFNVWFFRLTMESSINMGQKREDTSERSDPDQSHASLRYCIAPQEHRLFVYYWRGLIASVFHTSQ